MSMSYTYTQYFNHNKIYNLLSSITVKAFGQQKKWCVIQSGRRVHQLGTVTTFTRMWVADMMGTCFIVLLIYHWRWIWWRRNPMLERAQRRRLIPIIWEKNNLWIERLGSINPLKEPTPILLGQEKKLVSVKLHNIHICKILLLTLL
jgi:hypothetical protein